MAFNTEKKAAVINEYKESSHDTGSTAVQIAMLTERIKILTDHLQSHAKDFSSKRGMLMMVGRRNTYLKYLERTDEAKYKALVQRLGLKK